MTTWFAPGRVEVLGKHTDYAGGRCLVMALDRGVTATVADAPGNAPGDTLTARSLTMPDEIDLRSDAALPAGHWGNYLTTVVQRLEHNFGPLRGGHLTIDTTLPLASGMSSSSAMIVAAALALAHHNGFPRTDAWTAHLDDPAALATYLACVENGAGFGPLTGLRGVGTRGGSEDHTAMVMSRPGELGLFDFSSDVPVRERSLRLDPDLRFVVVMSGVLAEKTGPALAHYNRSSELARAAVAVWNEATGRADANLGAALREVPDARARLTALVRGDAELARRVHQFLTESEDLIPRAADALSAGDLAGFGDLVAASQAGADAGLGNQTPETRALVATALDQAAHAASAFGAGYGGSVWALVDRADADGFAEAWLARYRRDFRQHADAASVLVTQPSGSVREMDPHRAP